MKILIINPNSDSNTDRIMAEKARSARGRGRCQAL